MSTVRLTVDLAKITDNVRRTLALCHPFGLEVVGVVKGVCGLAPVSKAVLAGGIETLGDARLDNVARLRDAGIDARIMLVRSPALSEAARCVALADVSLNADLGVLRALSHEAVQANKVHQVVLMADLDTGREGFTPQELPSACREAAELAGLKLRGIGVYFDRQSDDEFRETGVRRLVALAKRIEAEVGVPLPVVSGGSTNVFRSLTLKGRHVPGVTELRLGTAILLGLSSSTGPRRIEGFRQDTFVLDAELIEVKQRNGLIGILPLGHSDTRPDLLFPLTPGVKVLRATNDHTVVDLSGMSDRPRVGDRVAFELGYSALCRLAGSPYVRIEYS